MSPTGLAEDLVQDCFVRLAGRVLPVSDPAAYRRRMVVNAAHSHHGAELGGIRRRR